MRCMVHTHQKLSKNYLLFLIYLLLWRIHMTVAVDIMYTCLYHLNVLALKNTLKTPAKRERIHCVEEE